MKRILAEDKFPVDLESEISSLIADLIEATAKEAVPPRLRELAEQLEAALTRHKSAAPKE